MSARSEPTKVVSNRTMRRAVERSRDAEHAARLAADPRGYTRANREHRVACAVRSLPMPAGVHVSPMHLSRNENEHTCVLDCFDYGSHVMQHAGVHRCRCGVSFGSAA